ncbi:MAG: sugar ABC transporter permease, partial [Acutalibacteraceae bacterium]|nr:sugar ABC transporter permease [Acutalibacteraceae bacterium]
MKSDKLRRGVTPYLFVLPYFALFILFVAVPVVIAIALSFTNFNAIQFPDFVGIKNYIDLFLQDEVFIRYVIPNTIVFAVIVG